jgi:hypothetical protein
MSEEGQVVATHPAGESQNTGNPASQTSSVDTFAGKVHVRWAAEATVSSLGLMPFFIEFLKTALSENLTNLAPASLWTKPDWVN